MSEKFKILRFEMQELRNENERLEKENAELKTKINNFATEIIKYLKEKCPYPEDIFCKKIGRATRVGYNSCIYKIEDFFKEIKEAREK